MTLFTKVGFGRFTMSVPDPGYAGDIEFHATNNDTYIWLTLEEAHQIKDMLEHMIAVVSAREIKG